MNYLDDKEAAPKYRQLAERLRREMKTGALKPGDRLPTLIEMRDDHKISRPTVERAYALLERDGLIERLHGAGVFVKSPSKRQTNGIIGLSGKGFGFSGYSSYWSHLLGGAREAAAQAEMQLLILDSASLQGWEKVDGVLVCDWDDHRVPRKELPGLPLVSLLSPIAGIASVVNDDSLGMQMAVEHLLALGHRKIAYLHSHTDHVVACNRITAYRETLKAVGVEVDRAWLRLLGGNYFYGAHFSQQAHIDVMRWLREDWAELGCTALLCHNDETAVGAIQALKEQGLSVPGDVSVMGFDGTEFCDLVSPRLSSIQVPLREIGAAGVELLLQQIQADAVSDEHIILISSLRTRETTAAHS